MEGFSGPERLKSSSGFKGLNKHDVSPDSDLINPEEFWVVGEVMVCEG